MGRVIAGHGYGSEDSALPVAPKSVYIHSYENTATAEIPMEIGMLPITRTNTPREKEPQAVVHCL